MNYNQHYHLNKQEFYRLKRRYELGWARGAKPVFMDFLYNRMVEMKAQALPSIRLQNKLH